MVKKSELGAAQAKKSVKTAKSAKSAKTESAKSGHALRALHPSWMIVAASVGVITGVVLALVCRPTIFSHWLWVLVAVVALILAVKMPRRAFLPLALASGALLVCWRVTPNFIAQEAFGALAGQQLAISGRVAKDPDKSGGTTTVIIENPQILTGANQNATTGSATTATNSALTAQNMGATDTAPTHYTGRLYVQLAGSTPDIQRSDQLTISGKLSEGFGTYLGSMFRAELTGVERPQPGDFFVELRDAFAAGIRDYLPSPEVGLGLGYLLGLRTGVDDQLIETLRVVGLTHIIVASGAHLGVLTGLAKRLFGRLSRFGGFFGAALFTLIFVGITGVTPSMSRAALVALLSLTAWYFGRKFQPWRIVLLAMAATLLYNPMNALDLGWLLSFASFGGIMVLNPLIVRFFYGCNRQPGFVASTVLSSLAAALLCTPILLYFYGSVSLISIVANLFILPTISVAMGLTFATGVAALVAGALPVCVPIATLCGQLAKIVIDYHLAVINFLGEQRYFLIEITPNNPLVFLLYLPLLIPVLQRILRTLLRGASRAPVVTGPWRSSSS